MITFSALENYRAHAFRRRARRRIASEKSALRFIEEAGFLLLWSSEDQVNLPSLSESYASSRGDWGWWDWKQTLPAKKACFYAKVLRAKGTFISWDFFPDFLSVYAGPDDYEEAWRAGTLDRTQKRLLDILAASGPLMTKDLRLAYGPSRKENTRRVLAALVALQRRFLVCPAGGDTEGWSHHLWDLVERWVPKRYLRAGRARHPEKAGARLAEQYLRLVGATSLAEICWTFSWPKETARAFLARLPHLRQVDIEEIGPGFLALADNLPRLNR